MRTTTHTGTHELRYVGREMPKPETGEMVVEVAALGNCGSDLLTWERGFECVTPPVVIGHEFSGTVADANDVPYVSRGDRVVVEPLLNYGESGPCGRALKTSVRTFAS